MVSHSEKYAVFRAGDAGFLFLVSLRDALCGRPAAALASAAPAARQILPFAHLFLEYISSPIASL